MMMTKMDIFGQHMQQMEEKLNANTIRDTVAANKIPMGPSATPASNDSTGEKEWDNDFDPSPKECDAIMLDAEAETKKRAAAMASAKNSKKTKPLLFTKTRSQS